MPARRLLAVAAAASALGACGWVGFRKPATDQELALEREVRAFYSDVQRAFAVGNEQALALMLPSWGAAPRRAARFKPLALSFDDLGPQRAVVTLKYSLDGETAARQDTLVKRSGRWSAAESERLP